MREKRYEWHNGQKKVQLRVTVNDHTKVSFTEVMGGSDPDEPFNHPIPKFILESIASWVGPDHKSESPEPKINLDIKQALRDAEILLNGGPPDDFNCEDQESLDNIDPSIEEYYPRDGMDHDDPVTLQLMVGGDHVLCEVPPQDGEAGYDVAHAIKHAGLHIIALARRCNQLEALMGRQQTRVILELRNALHALAKEYGTVQSHVYQAAGLGTQREPSRVLTDARRLIANLDAKKE